MRNDLLREAQIELVKKQPYSHHSKDSSRPQNPPGRPNNCSRCGQTPSHGRAYCPASEAICHNCKKKGHFKAFCRSKSAIDQLAETTEIQDGVDSLVTSKSAEESDDNSFLGMIHENKSNPWVIELTLNDQAVQFKIDTGADVTVIPNTEYSRSRDGPLSPADRTLSGPGQHVLKVKGKFEGYLERNHRSIQQTVYVIEDLHKALLGSPAIEALQILSFVEPVQASDIFIQFPQLFTGLGKLQDSYQIKLRNDAKPFALNAPRRIAIPLLPKVKEELQRMEALGVISKIEEPTEWCSPIVVVPKPNGKVRICVDLTKLNTSVCRERHILPSVEQTLAQVGDAKYFSKLDANSGFWQIELAPESSKLTTFITPFGRYAFNRLPFGITSAPEHFQRKMCGILSDLEGVICLIDDVLVYGKTEQEHDQCLKATLRRISEAGLTLSKEKCIFGATSISFLGQTVNSEGIQPDQNKIHVICDMKPPSNLTELRRFLGMLNQLSKFSPHITDKTQPLQELLSTKTQWVWGEAQDRAFTSLKNAITSSEVLAMYDLTLETIVSADASAYGLGAVL